MSGHDATFLRTAIGHYITALMVDGGANVAACEKAMDEALDALAARLAATEEALADLCIFASGFLAAYDQASAADGEGLLNAVDPPEMRAMWQRVDAAADELRAALAGEPHPYDRSDHDATTDADAHASTSSRLHGLRATPSAPAVPADHGQEHLLRVVSGRVGDAQQDPVTPRRCTCGPNEYCSADDCSGRPTGGLVHEGFCATFTGSISCNCGATLAGGPQR